ncbi:MAG TPA: sugar phosphate nucleotidyltransferase [Gaiellaceae bacterium]|nr:sugar phosphate nucleotidyltransferase [Gaiellaceae bacterium]
MDAIVMAAGEGRRLRPLTDTWPKPLLPIDGRPVIATLLHELAAAGLTRVTVVTGHLAEQLEELVGDGSGFGLEARFARQQRPDGSADAVEVAIEAGAAPPAIVVAADTVYQRGDVGRFAEAFAEAGPDGGVAVRRDPPPGPGRSAVGVEDGRVTRIPDDDPAAELASAALWGLGDAVARELGSLAGPPFELAEAYQRAIDAGAHVIAVEIGATRDLTRPLDLVRENFFYLSKGP